MRTNVYIDGFNLYYGLFSNKKRRLPWKWLDVRALCNRLLPRGKTLNRIRYFTADVVPRKDDLEQANRQQTYLRALATIDELSIHRGTFLTSVKSARIARSVTIPRMRPDVNPDCVAEVERAMQALRFVDVERTEEKGSDVNLASYLMLDVATRDCDSVMLISNDSDLASPLRLARETWMQEVIVVNPQPGRPTAPLQRLADIYRHIRPEVVRACQFPDEITDTRGRIIRKPRKWARDEQRYLNRLNQQP